MQNKSKFKSKICIELTSVMYLKWEKPIDNDCRIVDAVISRIRTISNVVFNCNKTEKNQANDFNAGHKMLALWYSQQYCLVIVRREAVAVAVMSNIFSKKKPKRLKKDLRFNGLV